MSDEEYRRKLLLWKAVVEIAGKLLIVYLFSTVSNG